MDVKLFTKLFDSLSNVYTVFVFCFSSGRYEKYVYSVGARNFR